MSIFRIGQRVKFVRRKSKHTLPPSQWLPIGSVGTVIPHDGLLSSAGNWLEHKVAFDGDLHRSRYVDGWQLEPLYDGNVKVEWSECVWKPEGVSA